MLTPITTRDSLVLAGSLFCTLSGWKNIVDGTVIALNIEDQLDNVSLSLFYQPPGIKDYFFDGPDYALYASENDVDYNGLVVSGGLENIPALPGQATWAQVQAGATITVNGQQESGFQGVDAVWAWLFSQYTVQQILADTNIQFLGQMASRVQGYLTAWLSGLTVSPYVPAVPPTLESLYPLGSNFQSGIEMTDASGFLLTLVPGPGSVTVGRLAVPS